MIWKLKSFEKERGKKKKKISYKIFENYYLAIFIYNYLKL